MTREEALALLQEFTRSESLIKHALAVEAAMRQYAPRFGGDLEQWGLTGLIHDFDYERWPNPPNHTREGARVLRERGCDEEIVGAMLSHADWNWDQYAEIARKISKAAPRGLYPPSAAWPRPVPAPRAAEPSPGELYTDVYGPSRAAG